MNVVELSDILVINVKLEMSACLGWRSWSLKATIHAEWLVSITRRSSSRFTSLRRWIGLEETASRTYWSRERVSMMTSSALATPDGPLTATKQIPMLIHTSITRTESPLSTTASFPITSSWKQNWKKNMASSRSLKQTPKSLPCKSAYS